MSMTYKLLLSRNSKLFGARTLYSHSDLRNPTQKPDLYVEVGANLNLFFFSADS